MYGYDTVKLHKKGLPMVLASLSYYMLVKLINLR